MRPGARPRARRHSARARERAMPSEAYDNVVRGGLKLKTSALAVGKSVDKKAKKRHKREKKDKKEVRRRRRRRRERATDHDARLCVSIHRNIARETTTAMTTTIEV